MKKINSRNALLSLSLCAAGLLATNNPSFANSTTVGGYQWMPTEAVGGGLSLGNSTTPQVLPEITITKTPKATANIANYNKIYTLELAKYNIKNNGTDAVATTKGLNEALQAAKASGANRIVFPKGTYLISETEPVIFDLKNTVVDFNGSTLQMNTNGLPNYVMVRIVEGAENLRLTNGIFRGDRDTHDYETQKNHSHEGCSLLELRSGKNLEFDNMTVTNAPGFAIRTLTSGANNRAELLAKILHSVTIKFLEQGAFSDKGEKVVDTTKTRTSKPYDMSKSEGEFEFGFVTGYMGYPFILDRNYQAVFYDENMKFIEKRNLLQYRRVKLPTGTKFMHLEFNQPEVSTKPAHYGTGDADYCGRITNFKPPTDVHFHNNIISNNRGLGIAFTGGQKWVIENNLFEGNGGVAPGYAIDFEDGWELMQDVVVRKNSFTKNFGDLVVCAGSELLIEDNNFESNVSIQARVYNSTIQNNLFNGNRVFYLTRTGVLNIRNNIYNNNPLMEIKFEGKGVADGLMRKPGEAVATPALNFVNETLTNVAQIRGTYFNFEKSKLNNVKMVAGNETVLTDLRNNELQNVSLWYDAKGPEVAVNLRNNKGELTEAGPGLTRKKLQPSTK
jgi:hypothetical protein